MPPPNDIQPFIERLTRDPGAALVDEAFARAFNRLPTSARRAVMERVEAVRRQMAATERVARITPTEPVWTQTYDAEFQAQDRLGRPHRPPTVVSVNIDDVLTVRRLVDPAENRPPPQVIDESSSVAASPALAQAARIEQMRRDMAREIEEYRFRATQEFQERPVERRSQSDFVAWSRNVEQVVQSFRERWESRIADEDARFVPYSRPTPPVAAWPDPAEYGPNGRYATQRGALSAFTRAVNNAYATRVAGGAREEERDRIHINGTMEVRSLWRGWQEMPSPAPTTPDVGETSYPRPEAFFPPAFNSTSEATQAWANAMVSHGERVPLRHRSREWSNHYHNGARDIREAYMVARPETPLNPTHWAGPLLPPPTTQPWRAEPATSVDDETDVMIKHLPRSGKCVIVSHRMELAQDIRARGGNIFGDMFAGTACCVAMASGSSLIPQLRGLRWPIFIDPRVFELHAAHRLEWEDGVLDALIELQGEIPDEETI